MNYPEAHPVPIHWANRPWVTVAEAAQILSRPQDWVRRRSVGGTLRRIHPEDGQVLISTGSIAAYIERTIAQSDIVLFSCRDAGKDKAKSRGSRPPSQSRPRLRLVVDNT